jgi:hypothetical protein
MKFMDEINKYERFLEEMYGNLELDGDKLQKFRDTFDIKEFWSQKLEDVPMMSQLATRVLEIQAQSSSSERCFSGLTYLLNKQRTNIDKHLAGELTLNYMIQHRKGASKLLKLPPFGKDWPEGEKNRIRMPHEEDQDHDEDDLPDGENEEDEYDNLQDEEVIEEVVYPDDVVIDETEVGALRPRRGGDRVNYRQLAGYRE